MGPPVVTDGGARKAEQVHHAGGESSNVTQGDDVFKDFVRRWPWATDWRGQDDHHVWTGVQTSGFSKVT